MGAAKESPATQVLTWAVTKLDEASKIDWAEKLNALAASKPAYLRNGVLGVASPSRPAPARSGGASEAELDAALGRASRAEARADGLARRVTELERELAATRSTTAAAETKPDTEVDLQGEEEHHKSHWWSRQH